MKDKVLFQINEFSMLTGISKDTLRFYDKIKLLSPDLRGPNNYRYYTEHQLEFAFLIGDLRGLGIGLEEIKAYALQRSPKRLLSFFEEQTTRIEAEIKHLRSLQNLMKLRSDMVIDALKNHEDVVFLEKKEAEPIFLAPLPKMDSTESDMMIMSYNYAISKGINVSFPSGVLIKEETLKNSNISSAYRFYFKVTENPNSFKNAGLYAVYYCPLSSDPNHIFYKPLLQFIEENGLHIIGDIYEEYPLDELCANSWKDFRVRIEVQVSK